MLDRYSTRWGHQERVFVQLTGVSGTPASSYQVIATPLAPNQTGVRYFCSFADAVVRASPSTAIATCNYSVNPLQ